MSSARKRAAIQKAHNETDALRQRLMLAEHHASIMKALAEELSRQHDRMRETLQGIADADWRKWEDLASPEEFVTWAKRRAIHALTPNAM
jgi:hypothetical protein